MIKILRPGKAVESTPGAIKIGRANDNDIVIPEVLASRHHATLIPTPHGTEIHDNRSINGTFVNGARVDSAVLHDGDVVTIGNIDLVFAGGTLVRRDESATATRTGGLDVRGVTWTIENNKTLLDDISLGGAARDADGRHRALGCGQVDVRAGWSPGTRTRPGARLRSRATTSTPSTPRCAAGSAWCPRTTWCTGS